MKKILVVAMLAALIAPVVSASDFGNINPGNSFGTNALTVAYTYDGYCDGATLNIANGKVTGVYSSPCASCPFTNTLNGITGKQNGVAAAGFKYTPDDYSIFTVVRADHTWTHYYEAPPHNVMNSGTWTECTAASGKVAANNLPSYTSK